MERLSGLDTGWLRAEEAKHPLVNVILLRFGAPIADRDARAWIEERLLSFPRFRQRVALNGAMWRPSWEIDARFDLDRHVRLATIDRNDAGPPARGDRSPARSVARSVSGRAAGAAPTRFRSRCSSRPPDTVGRSSPRISIFTYAARCG